jgi:Caspase recruitment domain
VRVKIVARLKRLQQLHQPMIEKLSAKPVAAMLFQNDVLTLRELEKVQCSATPCEAAEYLIDRLLIKGNDVSYNRFLAALGATNQGHILLWLTHDGMIFRAGFFPCDLCLFIMVLQRNNSFWNPQHQ